MCQDHERVLLDDHILVGQAFVEFVTILVDNVAERDSDVAQGNDDVAAYTGVLRYVQNFEQQPVVGVAELSTDTEELAKRKSSCGSQSALLHNFKHLRHEDYGKTDLELMRASANVDKHGPEGRQQ